MVIYTQGTTGQIKGVCLSHQNLLANSSQIKHWFNTQFSITGDEIYHVMAPMPLFYSYGFVAYCVLMPDLGMHSLLIENPLDSKRLLKTVKHFRPEILVAITSILSNLMSDKRFKKTDLHRLKITLISGGRINESILKRWLNLTGCGVTNTYGLTEATAAVTIMDLNHSPPGTVGKPVTGCDLKIMRSDSVSATTGEVGEIFVSGPQVFSGYLGSPDQSAMALNDNWLKTGDLGYLDDNGWLYLVDRKKNVLHQSGYQVYPNEIEQVVCRYPGVSSCAAIGTPGISDKEHIVLYIVLSDPELNIVDLLRFCRSNLASYKVPQSIEVRNTLPISPMGVVNKNQLKKELMETLKG